MTWYVGRLFDHVHLRVSDLDASFRFYSAALGALGRKVEKQETWLQCDELYATDLSGGGEKSHIHLAFQTKDRAMVDAFHKAALAAGGRDNGRPGIRDYHPNYYAAFVLDPDGNNIEAVHHGPSTRTAEVIEIEQA